MTGSDETSTDTVVQRIVLDVAERHQGRSIEEIRAALERGVADAGLPDQPGVWSQTCAEEIAAGRVVVTDTAIDAEVREWRERHGTPEPGR